MIKLADVLRRHLDGYFQQYGQNLLPSQTRAIDCILKCRTKALGGLIYQCDCGKKHYVYYSCNHRACPQCGQADAEEWLNKQQVKLLPVPYFLVTFTVPEQLRQLIRSHQKDLYNLLFSESAGTLQDVAATPKYLGATLGFLGVLHTWSRQLYYHPHVHYVVPGGGLTKDQRQWLRLPNPEYFLPQPVLSRRWRNRFRDELKEHHRQLYEQVPREVWKLEWVVHVQPAGTGQSALKYLAAYVTKTALGSNRIISDDGQTVSLSYRDSRDGKEKKLHLAGHEFIRRFLQHVLPKGFQRVRIFGWWSGRAKKRWAKILALLDWKPPEPPIPEPSSPPVCPICEEPMRLIDELPRPPP